ncbi:hypothetical protein LT493_20720 [Streptomyces tricolor]|nr:hypothetical protein [Streptomyces tricolor]
MPATEGEAVPAELLAAARERPRARPARRDLRDRPPPALRRRAGRGDRRALRPGRGRTHLPGQAARPRAVRHAGASPHRAGPRWRTADELRAFAEGRPAGRSYSRTAAAPAASTCCCAGPRGTPWAAHAYL